MDAWKRRKSVFWLIFPKWNSDWAMSTLTLTLDVFLESWVAKSITRSMCASAEEERRSNGLLLPFFASFFGMVYSRFGVFGNENYTSAESTNLPLPSLFYYFRSDVLLFVLVLLFRHQTHRRRASEKEKGENKQTKQNKTKT